MNYLAHFYLSRHSEQLMVGNYIADGIKGKKYLQFDAGIARGILMHRAIDTFTDQHEIVHHSRSLLREEFGLLGGIIVDIFYDHFLAAHWSDYSNELLREFTAYCYKTFNKYEAVLPDRYKRMLPYMSSEDWLLSYSEIEGVRKSLIGMSHRVKFKNNLQDGADALEKDYDLFMKDFVVFFPELKTHIKNWESPI